MQRVFVAGLIAFALLFAVSSIVGKGVGQTQSALAQDATPVATTGVQPAQPVQDTDDNDVPWGLLGLLGLAGLAGLRRHEQPVRREPQGNATKVGMYDQK